MSNIIIFESGDQPVEVRLEGETVWLSLQQLADFFKRDKSVISRHLKNIFETDELERVAVVEKMQQLRLMAKPIRSGRWWRKQLPRISR